MLDTLLGIEGPVVNKTDVACSCGTFWLSGRILNKKVLSNYKAKKESEEHPRQRK